MTEMKPMISSEEIPRTMPAGVLGAPQSLSIQEIPVWDLRAYDDPDMVLVKVAACGVCGSDFRYYLGENPWAQHTLGRFVPNATNIVLGHEYAGTVVQVSGEHNRHLLGKRVAPICSKFCGGCEDCRSGRTRLCERTAHLGHGQGWGEQDFFPGAYAHYVPSWGATCFEIPASISFEEAAMMDILAVCVHVCDQGQIQTGRPVLIIGAGPAGNGIAQAALAMGASYAVLLDRSETAIKIAQRQNIGHAIHVGTKSQSELKETVFQLAPMGFGTVFDTVGSLDSLNLSIDLLGKAGTLVALSVHDQEIPLNFFRLGSEKRIVTSCNFEVGDYPRALAWLATGRLSVKEWLSPITLSEIPAAFERITSNPDAKGVFKMVIDPWQV